MDSPGPALLPRSKYSQGLLCLATPGSSGLGHEEEGMRREGGSPVTARLGFPVLSLTPSL